MGGLVLIAVVILLRASLETDDPVTERPAPASNRSAFAKLRDRANRDQPTAMVVAPRSVAPAPPPPLDLDLPPGPDLVIPSVEEPIAAVAPTPARGAGSGSARSTKGGSPGKDSSRSDGAGHGSVVGHDGTGGGSGVRRSEAKVALMSEAARNETLWQRPPSEADPSLKLVARLAPTGGATLKGRVVDAETGRAYAGVAVEAHLGASFMKTATDGFGFFRMPGILPGRRITVWIIGQTDTFVAERLDVTIPGEGDIIDAGVVRLLRGDELASHLEGWMGMFVSRRGQRNIVAAVSPWSPADRAGIEVGDVLLSIAGRDVEELGPRATGFLLRGPVGTRVGLSVQDRQGIVQKFQLERVLR